MLAGDLSMEMLECGGCGLLSGEKLSHETVSRDLDSVDLPDETPRIYERGLRPCLTS